MFNNILQYYYITNYCHGYLMYVIALYYYNIETIISLQYMLFIKKTYDQPIY